MTGGVAAALTRKETLLVEEWRGLPTPSNCLATCAEEARDEDDDTIACVVIFVEL